LGDVSTAWHTDSAGGIIIDPQTGNILAMAGVPDFDPNNFGKVTDPSVFQNPNVERVYELGSVIKSLTMSSGLDGGAITTATTYNDPGCMNIDKEHICNFDKKPRGKTTMQTIFDQSLNMGATFIQEQLGKDQFRNYFYKFGLNQKTGVDMPDEVSDLISNLTSTREVEYATASFGQGIALTPVSAVEAFSAVANNGMRVSPRVAVAIQYPDGYMRTLPRPAPVQVIKPAVAQTVAKMLVTTVDTSLLGGTLKLPHYSVAAKTGTAQVANPDGGGYYANEYLHSMFGFYPASNPRFLVLLYIVNPKNVNYASQTLAKPFMNLAQYLLTYYDVAPDR
jgi:cell division protein FtsI/penicillin-binding protein 2